MRHVSAGVFELSRWWLLDVCQVMLILAVITFADRQMGMSSMHVLTWVSRIAAIVYLGGSLGHVVRDFHHARGWVDVVAVGRWRLSVSVLITVAALIAVTIALTLFLDGIARAFGAMLP